MGRRFSVVLVVGLLLTGLFGWVYRSAGSGHQHTFTVVDGDHIQGVVFSAPQSGSWSWRLTVHAGTG